MQLKRFLLAACLLVTVLSAPVFSQAPAAELVVSAPAVVAAGDPIGVFVHPPAEQPDFSEVSVLLNGEALALHAFDGGTLALAAAPLGAETQDWPLNVTTVDALGRVRTFSAEVRITADPRPVEELNLPASALSVSTPEARDVEAEMVARVWAAALPDPLWREPFLAPLEGRNTSGYGDSRRYAPGGRVSFHQGTDLAAPEGTPVRATNDGIAVIAAEFPAYPIKGGLVIIDHGGGIMSYYLHQSRVLVEEGAAVSRGEVIGEVGTTGLSTGPHLHFEIRLHDRATNPLAWTGKLFP
jgi:murein DD-endopeptidase MepM/ murein hydrolase activator NlpD